MRACAGTAWLDCICTAGRGASLHAPLFDVPLLQLGKLPRMLLVQPFYDVLPPKQSPPADPNERSQRRDHGAPSTEKKGLPPSLSFVCRGIDTVGGAIVACHARVALRNGTARHGTACACRMRALETPG